MLKLPGQRTVPLDHVVKLIKTEELFTCGFFCVLEMGIEGLTFSSFLIVVISLLIFLLAVHFVVDFGWGFTLWLEFGVYEIVFGVVTHHKREFYEK